MGTPDNGEIRDREDQRRSQIEDDHRNLQAAMAAILQATFPTYDILERALCYAAEIGHQRGFTAGFTEGVDHQRVECPHCATAPRPTERRCEERLVMSGIWIMGNDPMGQGGQGS